MSNDNTSIRRLAIEFVEQRITLGRLYLEQFGLETHGFEDMFKMSIMTVGHASVSPNEILFRLLLNTYDDLVSKALKLRLLAYNTIEPNMTSDQREVLSVVFSLLSNAGITLDYKLMQC